MPRSPTHAINRPQQGDTSSLNTVAQSNLSDHNRGVNFDLPDFDPAELLRDDRDEFDLPDFDPAEILRDDRGELELPDVDPAEVLGDDRSGFDLSDFEPVEILRRDMPRPTDHMQVLFVAFDNWLARENIADELAVTARDCLMRVIEAVKAGKPPSLLDREELSVGDLGLQMTQAASVIRDSTLGRLDIRYRKRLEAITLPPDGFQNQEQVRAAGRLLMTYEGLRKRYIELGLNPLSRDPRVTEAQRLRMAFLRMQKQNREEPSDGGVTPPTTEMQNSRAKWGETARNVTRRAKVEASALQKLPEHGWKPPAVPLPKGLRWPREQFDQSPEFRKHGGIIRHLERLWKPLIAAGRIDMQLLRTFYPSTADAIDSYKSASPMTRKTGLRRSLPPDLDIPVVKPGSGRRRVTSAYSPAA